MDWLKQFLLETPLERRWGLWRACADYLSSKGHFPPIPQLATPRVHLTAPNTWNVVVVEYMHQDMHVRLHFFADSRLQVSIRSPGVWKACVDRGLASADGGGYYVMPYVGFGDVVMDNNMENADVLNNEEFRKRALIDSPSILDFPRLPLQWRYQQLQRSLARGADGRLLNRYDTKYTALIETTYYSLTQEEPGMRVGFAVSQALKDTEQPYLETALPFLAEKGWSAVAFMHARERPMFISSNYELSSITMKSAEGRLYTVKIRPTLTFTDVKIEITWQGSADETDATRAAFINESYELMETFSTVMHHIVFHPDTTLGAELLARGKASFQKGLKGGKNKTKRTYRKSQGRK
jgi:hypothetical protein